MRIIELHSENVMGIEAIDVTPERHINTIGGDNGQGKSSLLNSMVMALCGKAAMPAEPLRHGTEKGDITLRIEREEGDLIVHRTIGKEGRTSVTVTSAEGAKYSKPQAMLDSLIGAIGFDPYAFTKLGPKKQVEQLRELVGLDFTQLDEARQAIYDNRTEVSRERDQAAAQAAAIDVPPDTPDDKVSASDLVSELEAAQQANRDKSNAKALASQAEQAVARHCGEAKHYLGEIERLRQELEAAEAGLAKAEDDRRDAEQLVKVRQADYEAMPEIDCDPIHEKIRAADSVNAKVEAKQRLQRLSAVVKQKTADYEAFTENIKKIDAEKQELLSSAPWPVEGLAFAKGGVTYNGIPFDQCSSAEKLQVSLAMGMAANPELRVLIIRDGSLIGTKAMEVIRQQVEEKDFQVWIERVTDDPEGCSLFIQEGKVAQ